MLRRLGSGSSTPALARESFPATRDITYLDAAAVSLISRPVHEAVRGFLDLCLEPRAPDASQHHLVMDAMRQRAAEEAARLLNATTDEIGSLTGKLGALEGVQVKSALTKA